MRGRYAPSPTGRLHVGNLRTAVLAWLFARAAGSEFVVRVEDLDPQRSRPELERGQLDDLAAIGLDWDGPVVRQSERRARHDEAIERLRAEGRTYECWCTRAEIREATSAAHGVPGGAYPQTCRRLPAREREARRASGRPPAIRIDALGAEVAFTDRLRGDASAPVDDFVIRRNDGTPAYNLAVVVDDHDQRVEEVVRGDDLLETTPRQILAQRLLGFSEPAYAHVPLVLGADGERLAKRHGSVTLQDLAPGDALRWIGASLGFAGADPSDWIERFDAARLPADPVVFARE